VIGSKAERSRGFYSGLNERKGGEGEVWTEENNRKYMLPVAERVEKKVGERVVGGRDREGKLEEEEESGCDGDGDDVKWVGGVFNDNVRYSLYGQGENSNKLNQNRNQNGDYRSRANSSGDQEEEKGKITPKNDTRNIRIDGSFSDNDYSLLSASKTNYKITDNIRNNLEKSIENPEITQNFRKSGSREFYENKEYKEVKENREKKSLKKREKNTLNNSEYSLWGLEDDMCNKNKKNNSQYEIKKRIIDDGKNIGYEGDTSSSLQSEHWLDICTASGASIDAGVGGGGNDVVKKEKGKGKGKESEKKVNFDGNESERNNIKSHINTNNKLNNDKKDIYNNDNNNHYQTSLSQKKEHCMNRQYSKHSSPSKIKKTSKIGGKSEENNICDNHGNLRNNSEIMNTDNYRKHGNGNVNGNYEKKRVEPDNTQEQYSLCTYPLKRRKHTDAAYIYGDSYYSSFPLNSTNTGQDVYSHSSTTFSTSNASFPSPSPSYPSSCSLLHSLVDVLEKHQVQDSLSTSFPPSHTTSHSTSHSAQYSCSLLPMLLPMPYPRATPDLHHSSPSHPPASLYSDDVRDQLDVAI
jgi:hypothetical protein